MSVILSIYHIIGIFAGLSIILGGFLRFYTKSVKTEMISEFSKEITKTRESIDSVQEKRIVELHQKLDRECSTETIKHKVRDYVETEVKLMEQDIRQIKELTVDLKQILTTQQETLIAIQMSISELKPRIASLEERVQKLESSDK